MEWGVEAASLSKPRAYLGPRVLECPRLEGLSLLPHFACEPVPLIFLEGPGLLVDSYIEDAGQNDIRLTPEPIVKTHFAGVQAHTEVCDFLAELKRRFVPDLTVDDESGFFEERNVSALEKALAEAWETIAGEVHKARAQGQETFEVGGFLFLKPANEGGGEFDRLSAEHKDLLLEAERWFSTRYGGFGYTLDRSRESVTDLDFLMSDADDDEWGKRPEDPEVETFTQAAGLYFGRTVAKVLGGVWRHDEEEGLVLGDVGRIGLLIDPLQIAAERLVGGPCHAFSHHLTLYDEFVKRLG
jgi:hypothetical protein